MRSEPIFIFAMLALSVCAIDIWEPQDGLETMNANPMIMWDNIQVDHFMFYLADNPELTDAIVKNQTKNYHQVATPLDPGTWFYQVEAYDGGIMDQSEIRTYIVHEKPVFTIDIDHSDDHEVVFHINAPLGASLNLTITNDDGFYLPYAPSQLTTDSFTVFLTDRTEYHLEATMGFFGYKASFEKDFDLTEPVKAVKTVKKQSVKKKIINYTLDVVAKDKTLEEKIAGVEVKIILDNETIMRNKTNKEGITTFQLHNETYSVIATHNDYYTEKSKETLDDNLILEYEMLKVKYSQKEEEKAEEIKEEQETEDIITITKEKVGEDLKIEFISNGHSECSLQVNIRDTMTVKYKERVIPVNGTNAFLIEDIIAGDFEYFVKCDEITSEIRYFKKKEKASVDEIEKLEAISDDFENGVDEIKEIVAILEIDKVLETAKKKLESADADVHNIMQKIPQSVKIRKSTQEIYYPNGEDAQAMLEEYVLEREVILTRKELSSLKKYVNELQDGIEIDTSIKVVEVESISGDKSTYTIVIKKISGAPEEYIFMEEMSYSSDYIASEIKSKNKIIKIDNYAYAYNLAKVKLIYTIHKNVNINSMGETRSAVLITDVQKAPPITGMVTGVTTRNLGIIGGFILFFAAIVTIFLVLPNRKISLIDPNISALTKSIHKVMDHLESKRYDRALSLYPEVLSKYERLSAKEKIEFKEMIDHLYQELMTYDIKGLLVKANRMIDAHHELNSKGRSQESTLMYHRALDVYSKVMKSYNDLSFSHRPIVDPHLERFKVNLSKVNLQ